MLKFTVGPCLSPIHAACENFVICIQIKGRHLLLNVTKTHATCYISHQLHFSPAYSCTSDILRGFFWWANVYNHWIRSITFSVLTFSYSSLAHMTLQNPLNLQEPISHFPLCSHGADPMVFRGALSLAKPWRAWGKAGNGPCSPCLLSWKIGMILSASQGSHCN